MITLPYLIHQCVPSVAQTSIAAINQIESKINPFPVGLGNDSSIEFKPQSKSNTKNLVICLEKSYSNLDIGFHNGYVHSVYITAHKTLLSLNDNSDIPPIISDNVNDKLKHHSSVNMTKDSMADISPYRSRSLLYIQQKKANPDELNEFKGA